jgi:glycerol-3-phosphate acyltransferase PlsY
LTSGVDLREVGSGSTGGTNAARFLGKWGRWVVGGLDLLKGAAIVGVAKWVGLEPVALGAAVFAAVLGNIHPVQMGFRGGKGIGVSLGAFLVYCPSVAIAISLLIVALQIITKHQQVSGVAGYVIAAAVSPVLESEPYVAAAVIATSALVVYGNRTNFCKDWSEWRTERARHSPPLDDR